MSEVIFIPASQAYTKSMEAYEARLRKNREELRDLIEAATKKGQFQVIYDRPLNENVVSWLVNEYGYEVTKKELNNNIEKEIWIINWENANV